MDFDWLEYLDFAKHCSGSSEESTLRIAISRAYYCVFNKAGIFAKDHLGYERGHDQSHKRMWLEFRNQPGQTSSAIYNKGMDLKRKREQADYEAQFSGLRADTLTIVLADAEALLVYLEQLVKSKADGERAKH